MLLSRHAQTIENSICRRVAPHHATWQSARRHLFFADEDRECVTPSASTVRGAERGIFGRGGFSRRLWMSHTCGRLFDTWSATRCAQAWNAAQKTTAGQAPPRIALINQSDCSIRNRTGTKSFLRQRTVQSGWLRETKRMRSRYCGAMLGNDYPVFLMASLRNWGARLDVGWSIAHRDALEKATKMNKRVASPFGENLGMRKS